MTFPGQKLSKESFFHIFFKNNPPRLDIADLNN